MQLKFQALFYEDKKGNSPVEGFLDSLPKKARLKMLRWIGLLEEKGVMMPRGYAKNFIGTDLWELICNFGSDDYRLFYFFDGKIIILLHGFSKKTEETPKSEIDIAEKRMAEYRNRKKGER